LLNDPLRQQAWALIQAARQGEYAGVELLEILNLGDLAAEFGVRNVERARDWFRKTRQVMHPKKCGPISSVERPRC
jgi:hypothetical protein